MNDTQFDNFFNDTFKDHAVPVPAGLWEKVVEGQFDQFIGSKLRNAEAPVPSDLWDKINDKQFDNFVASTLSGAEAPVPGGLWDKISDGQFDSFVAGKFTDTEAPVPSGLWDRIGDGQFDSFVASKLKDHEAPVPAGLWEKVKPEEDDDRVGFFWFRYPAVAVLIFGLLAAGALGGYYYFTAHNKKADAASILPSSKTNDGTSGQPTVTPPVHNDADTHTPSNTKPDGTPANDNNVTINKNGDVTGKALKNGQQDIPSVKDGQLAATSSEASVSGVRRKKGIDLRPVDPKNNPDLANGSYDIFRNKANASDQPATEHPADEYFTNYHRNLLNASTISSMSGFSLSQNLSDKQLSTLNHTSQFRNVIICPSDNKNRNTDWYLEAYVSPEMPFKSVSNISATPLYLLKKDSSESMQVSYGAGLRIVKPITDNILLKAGVHYSQINEKYVYRTENEVKTTTVVSVRTIIRAPGDTVIVRDTSILQTVGFRNNTVYNHYRSIDLPVTIGYQFGNEDLKLGINAGVIFNLSSWYQGVILDSSLATVTLNKTGNPVYKSNLGMGLYAGFSVVKKLSDDMHIFFEPHFRYNLSNMTTSQSSFNQRFSLGGLSIGLRLNLNRK